MAEHLIKEANENWDLAKQIYELAKNDGNAQLRALARASQNPQNIVSGNKKLLAKLLTDRAMKGGRHFSPLANRKTWCLRKKKRREYEELLRRNRGPLLEAWGKLLLGQEAQCARAFDLLT